MNSFEVNTSKEVPVLDVDFCFFKHLQVLIHIEHKFLCIYT